MKYLYFLFFFSLSCNVKKQAYLGEYGKICSDFDTYRLHVNKNKRFSYYYNGHLMHLTKNGKWKITGDTLTLFADNKIFKSFKFNKGQLCEIFTRDTDTLFCSPCYYPKK